MKTHLTNPFLKTVLLVVLLGYSLNTKAQTYVTIPDTNFAAFLRDSFPSCMNGNQLDITCPDVTNALSMDLSQYYNHLEFESIDGIQYFTSLTSLNCSQNQLTSLPVLPAGLISLDCNTNHLTTLPMLPAGLLSFDCSFNHLATLPILPSGLTHLSCDYNSLVSLPDLPVSLEVLTCGYNQLTSLPELPSGLLSFSCSSNMLMTLPLLPSGLTHLNCDYNKLVSLPTLPASLEDLVCGNNQLTSLPELPAGLLLLSCNSATLVTLPLLPPGLKNISCQSNNLVSFLNLPASLELLNCSKNQLTSLPDLPAGLKTLDCNTNKLVTLPALSVSLAVLDCSHNQLTTFPAIPSSLTNLDCSGNQITALPALPVGLTIFWCSTNLLTVLPTLPEGLTEIGCGNNQLTVLPALPASLIELWCNDNQLTVIQKLGVSTVIFNCSHNLLTSLPDLPDTLLALDCSYNQIRCFPKFPSGLDDVADAFLDISGNPYTCVPNIVLAMMMSPLPPLCIEGDPVDNQNACESIINIGGHVYIDENADCAFGSGDAIAGNVIVKLYDNQDDFIGQWQGLDSEYGFSVGSGSYRIAIDTVDKPYRVLCSSPGTDSLVTLASYNSGAHVDFSISCKPGFDFGCKSVAARGWVFPGQMHTLEPHIADIMKMYNLDCPTSPVSGTVTIDIDGPVTYQYPISGARVPVVNGHQLVYTVSNFYELDATGLQSGFQGRLLTDTTAQLGDQVCVHVSVAIDQPGDNDSSNNTYDFCYPVTNSFDPNIKEVYPINVKPDYADYFTYTVHFQNTGNASAGMIRLADTLDPDLDNESFEVIASSHPCQTSMRGNIVNFNFKDIMLPDSLSDPEGSIGFVQYRVKAKPNLPLGTKINNTAYIYFDYNDAIVTNTTVNEYVDHFEGIAEYYSRQAVIYPNPGKGNFTVQFPEKTGNYTVEAFTILGERLQAASGTGTMQLDLTNYPNGIYWLKISGNNGTFSQRVVKQ